MRGSSGRRDPPVAFLYVRDRRYQIFISSTYTDLVEERQGVLNAVLELGCFPAGMEFFPASNRTPWAHIARVIDDSDYYLVVVGGRYGSLTEDGLSFTQREYEYAQSQGKPILAFIHEDPGSIAWRNSEHDPVLRDKLGLFIGLLEAEHLVRRWGSVDSLRAAVATSLSAEMDDNPQPGWARAKELPARRITGFEVVRHRETLLMRPDGFDNELSLEVRAASSGLEVFFRQSSGSGTSTLRDVELLTPNMTLLTPFVRRDPWTKYFVYLGRQMAQGETATVVLRESYGQDGAWDRENIHGYYVSHPLELLELEVSYPFDLQPLSARWREYQGGMEMGDVITAGELDVSGESLRLVVPNPPLGHNFVIEWSMPTNAN